MLAQLLVDVVVMLVSSGLWLFAACSRGEQSASCVLLGESVTTGAGSPVRRARVSLGRASARARRGRPAVVAGSVIAPAPAWSAIVNAAAQRPRPR